MSRIYGSSMGRLKKKNAHTLPITRQLWVVFPQPSSFIRVKAYFFCLERAMLGVCSARFPMPRPSLPYSSLFFPCWWRFLHMVVFYFQNAVLSIADKRMFKWSVVRVCIKWICIIMIIISYVLFFYKSIRRIIHNNARICLKQTRLIVTQYVICIHHVYRRTHIVACFLKIWYHVGGTACTSPCSKETICHRGQDTCGCSQTRV